MTLPLLLPDWIPWWAQLALLVLGLLFGLALLMMPFAVFGLKGRLDLLEAQLDDIHAELRMLSMRLPDPEPTRQEPRRGARRAVIEPERYDEEPPIKRPAPPDRSRTLRADDRGPPRHDAPARSEPRVRWPPDPGRG